MPKYVVISNHPPNACPSANTILRKRAETFEKDLPPMLQKHGIKVETILHLDPGHKIVWVLEAASAESVRDMIYDSGLSQWNDFEFYMGSTLDWVTKAIEKLPTIF